MLVDITIRLLFIVGLMVAFSVFIIVGTDRINQPMSMYRDRLFDIIPYASILVAVLLANKVARDVGPQISWLVGWNVTDHLRTLDGLLLWPLYPENTPQFVVFFQTMEQPALTSYFSFIYIYGYVFLLVFPVVAYFFLNKPQPLQRTLIAYGTNYIIGVLMYLIFIAYGPRNLEIGEGLLYTTYAQYVFLTSAVNTNVNVFPSLHTSLAITVAILAWTTRNEYPRWLPIAVFLAISVVLSTMYLGIHWASDVFAGFILAWFSVRIGIRYENLSFNLESVRKQLSGLMPARGR